MANPTPDALKNPHQVESYQDKITFIVNPTAEPKYQTRILISKEDAAILAGNIVARLERDEFYLYTAVCEHAENVKYG